MMAMSVGRLKCVPQQVLVSVDIEEYVNTTFVLVLLVSSQARKI